MYPEFADCYIPWLIFLILSGIPCYAALVISWKIAANIGKDKSFSLANAKLLKGISVLAASDSAFVFLGNTLFLLLNMNHPSIILTSLFIVFLGIAISVAAKSGRFAGAKRLNYINCERNSLWMVKLFLISM